MPFSLDGKLVVAVASSALFDLTESDRVFREQGEDAYRRFQRERETESLKPGVAFPFLRRLLALNGRDSADRPVEIVLLSRNDPDTGTRAFNSARFLGIELERAVFTSGAPPWGYAESFGACLFLSANPSDVREALRNGLPAGQVLENGASHDDPDDPELRVAFDFDGVLADDASEKVYQEGGLNAFHAVEDRLRGSALEAGPLQRLLVELGKIQAIEKARKERDASYRPRLKTAIATARSAPAHQRVVTTLREWGLRVDQAFFLGGIEKTKVLERYRPHIFFDDQLAHARPASRVLPAVHVPFGVANTDRN
jgi:5'-nucleotidase